MNEFDEKKLESSKIDSHMLNEAEWNLSVWQITNVLPTNNPLEKGIAAFPEELASRLVQLFSFRGETVLDPFLGSVDHEQGRSGLREKFHRIRTQLFAEG